MTYKKDITYKADGTYEMEIFERQGTSTQATGSVSKGIYSLKEENGKYILTVEENGKSGQLSYEYIVSSNKLYLTTIN